MNYNGKSEDDGRTVCMIALIFRLYSTQRIMAVWAGTLRGFPRCCNATSPQSPSRLDTHSLLSLLDVILSDFLKSGNTGEIFRPRLNGQNSLS